MELYGKAFSMLLESITGNDFIILIVAIATAILWLVIMLIILFFNRTILKNRDSSKSALTYYRSLRMCYSLFVTMITIFPMLGMFGTVAGLLGLDLASGNMENIRDNFFIALTSTAWGIIFSVIFKFINALFCEYIEEKIELAKMYGREGKEGELNEK